MAEVTLARLVEARFGVRTTPLVNRALSSVGVTAAQLVRQDPNRLGFWMVNLSVNHMFAGPFNNPSSTRGVQIGPGGGSIIVLWDEDFAVTGWEWFIVAGAAASSLLVVEYIAIAELPGRAGAS